MRFGLTVAAFVASLLATAPAQAAITILYQYELVIDQGTHAPSYYVMILQNNGEFSHLQANLFRACTPLCRDWTLSDKGDHVELKVGDALLTFAGSILATNPPGTVIMTPSLPIGSFGSTSSGRFFSGVGQIGTVPEPSTWAMMILGFGAIGAAMRRKIRRRFQPV